MVDKTPKNLPDREDTLSISVHTATLENQVIDILKTVYDPEIPVNIYELGLVYRIGVDASGQVTIAMTLTSPACPVAGTLPGEVEQKIKAIPGISDCRVEVVWEPAWTQEMMSEAARLELHL